MIIGIAAERLLVSQLTLLAVAAANLSCLRA